MGELARSEARRFQFLHIVRAEPSGLWRLEVCSMIRKLRIATQLKQTVGEPGNATRRRMRRVAAMGGRAFAVNSVTANDLSLDAQKVRFNSSGAANAP
jgi:hypothetical protein